MNISFTFLTIAFMAVSILISGSNVDSADAQNTTEGMAASRGSANLLLSHYLKFDRLTAENGLSNDQLRAVVQDNRGFMWIGTLDGLNRYDGTSIKEYRYDPDDPNSLSNNNARALLVDRDGTLWIGTWNGGLNQYDWDMDHFIRYQHNPEDPHSLSNDTVRVAYEDSNVTILVGTTVGLNKLDRESGQFTRYQHDPDHPDSLSNDVVWTVMRRLADCDNRIVF